MEEGTIAPIPDEADDTVAHDRETRDLAQAMAEGGTRIEEGRPVGISWSTLTEEEKMTLLRGSFMAEELETLARRSWESTDK